VLVEQSRPELIWPVDIILGTGGSAIISGHWRAFALSHRLRIGYRLIFRFKLGALEGLVRVFDATASAAPTPFQRRWSEEVASSWRPSWKKTCSPPSLLLMPE
jgi:hypothetical protein